MSCRVDNYLNLCLTEAAQSPLRYRHGAIIVRGGKVIGRGHNAYRSGFDGGVLQHGSYGMTDFRPVHAKSKLKSKRRSSSSMLPSHCPPSGTSAFFRPFEVTSGGGHLANTPLSMHSEMMAIQDALSATTASSSRTFAWKQPCFKLSGDSKRKARLRRANLEQYVERVCRAALGDEAGPAQSSEWRFEGGASGRSQDVRGVSQWQRQREREEQPERGESERSECRREGEQQRTGDVARNASGVRPSEGIEASPSSSQSSSSCSPSRRWTGGTTTPTTPTSQAAFFAASPAAAAAA
ncbi:MAG: hypothetical protein Q9162_003466 [Coniocarpon cinnabarinum]